MRTADEKLRALEAQLASSEAERLEMRRMAVEAFKVRQGELKQRQPHRERKQRKRQKSRKMKKTRR